MAYASFTWERPVAKSSKAILRQSDLKCWLRSAPNERSLMASNEPPQRWLEVIPKIACVAKRSRLAGHELDHLRSRRGGLIMVQTRHIAAIYGEQESVKLSTTAGGEHILKEVTVQRAVGMISAALDVDDARRPGAAFR